MLPKIVEVDPSQKSMKKPRTYTQPEEASKEEEDVIVIKETVWKRPKPPIGATLPVRHFTRSQATKIATQESEEEGIQQKRASKKTKRSLKASEGKQIRVEAAELITKEDWEETSYETQQLKESMDKTLEDCQGLEGQIFPHSP